MDQEKTKVGKPNHGDNSEVSYGARPKTQRKEAKENTNKNEDDDCKDHKERMLVAKHAEEKMIQMKKINNDELTMSSVSAVIPIIHDIVHNCTRTILSNGVKSGYCAEPKNNLDNMYNPKSSDEKLEVRKRKNLYIASGAGNKEAKSLEDIENEFRIDAKKSLIVPNVYDDGAQHAMLIKSYQDIQEEIKKKYNNVYERVRKEELDKLKNKKGKCQEDNLPGIKNKVQKEMEKEEDWKRQKHKMGDLAEVIVGDICKTALQDRPGLVLRGFHTFKYLIQDQSQSLENIGIHLSKSSSYNSSTEHDILVLNPLHEGLNVTYLQVKRYLVFPWEQDQELGDRLGRGKAIKKLVAHTSEQLQRDIVTFLELTSDIDINKININVVAALPMSWRKDVPFCLPCQPITLTRDDYDHVSNPNWISALQKKLNICVDVTSPTEEYIRVAARYAGLHSLIPLRTLGQGFTKVSEKMDQVEKMRAPKEALAPGVKTSDEENLLIHLTKDQRAALDVPLDRSMVMVGPYGSGKTWLSLMQAIRFIEDCTHTGSKGLVMLVSQTDGENAQLLETFRSFAAAHETSNVSIQVATTIQLSEELKLPLIKTTDGGGYNDVEWYNQLAREMRRRHQGFKLLLVADEVNPKAVNHSSDVTKRSYDWRRMDVGTVRVVMCVRPLVASSGDVELTWPDNVTECRLFKCFRQTKQIHDCLHFMSRQVPAGVDWGRPLCPPDQTEIGTSVSGTVPVWYHLPDKITGGAGRAQLKEVMDEIQAEVEDCGVAPAQVPVIVSGADDEYKELAEAVRSVAGSTFSQVWERAEMMGCESRILVCITPIHGSSWQDRLSRAVTRLYIVTHSTGHEWETYTRDKGVDLETVFGKAVDAGFLQKRTVDRINESDASPEPPVVATSANTRMSKCAMM